MKRQAQKAAKPHYAFKTTVAPPVVGIGLTVTLILLGQFYFKAMISSFTSWTGYFLFATFAGMFTSGALERFVLNKSSTRIADLILVSAGLFCSFLTVALSHSKDAASSLMIVSVCILFGSFFLLANRQPAKVEPHDKSPADADWSIFLDNLLKLDLPQSLRSQIAVLLDAVWQAPADLPNFIPHQNYEIKSLLDKLDLAIRQNKISDAKELAFAIQKKLVERNSLILRNVEIEYENMSSTTLLPGKPDA